LDNIAAQSLAQKAEEEENTFAWVAVFPLTMENGSTILVVIPSGEIQPGGHGTWQHFEDLQRLLWQIKNREGYV
jgi:hypothetical protein